MATSLVLRRDEGQPLLSEDQAAEFLGLSGRPNPKGALRWLMRTRRLGYVRLGKGVYGFRRQDLEAFIAANHVQAATG